MLAAGDSDPGPEFARVELLQEKALAIFCFGGRDTDTNKTRYLCSEYEQEREPRGNKRSQLDVIEMCPVCQGQARQEGKRIPQYNDTMMRYFAACFSPLPNSRREHQVDEVSTLNTRAARSVRGNRGARVFAQVQVHLPRGCGVAYCWNAGKDEKRAPPSSASAQGGGRLGTRPGYGTFPPPSSRSTNKFDGTEKFPSSGSRFREGRPLGPWGHQAEATASDSHSGRVPCPDHIMGEPSQRERVRGRL